MSRSSSQIRLEAAWHEAGHAVAMYLQDHEIDHLHLMRPDGELVDGHAGLVQGVPRAITTIGDAIDNVVELLTGEAAFRIAWAAGEVSSHEVGGVEVEAPVEVLLAMGNGDTPGSRAAFAGYVDRGDTPDEKNARAVAAHFTSGGMEAELLVKFARQRAVAMVETPRFQALCGDLARKLLKRSPLSGDDAVAVLQRADTLYRIEGGKR